MMRGAKFTDMSPLLIDAILMEKYHQQYSEIDNIPTKTVIFLLRLSESEADYKQKEILKAKAEADKKTSKIRSRLRR